MSKSVKIEVTLSARFEHMDNSSKLPPAWMPPQWQVATLSSETAPMVLVSFNPQLLREQLITYEISNYELDTDTRNI